MKRLLALALLVALLAIGNTAAAGPLGVSMGDPIKPNKGWDARGYGTEEREYKGSLPFSSIHIQGTRKGGACGIFVNLPYDGLPFNNIRDRLEGKHGRPYRVRVFDSEKKAEWRFTENPDKVAGLILSYKTLEYRFENYHECEEDPEKAKAMREAAKKAVEVTLKDKGNIENTAAACPLGVCMGEPIKPDKGWQATGLGFENRGYKGNLNFDGLSIAGTRKGGACRVKGGTLSSVRGYKDLRDGLKRKYGRPYREEPFNRKLFGMELDTGTKAEWRPAKNPNKVATIILLHAPLTNVGTGELTGNTGELYLEYHFENYHECEKAEAAAKKAEEAAEEARKKRRDAEL